MSQTKNSILDMVTDQYLASLSQTGLPTPKQAEADLLEQTVTQIEMENQLRPKTQKLPVPNVLYPFQIARLMLTMYHICHLSYDGLKREDDTEKDPLAIYIDHGDREGIYSLSSSTFFQIAEQFNCTMTPSEFDHVMDYLDKHAPMRTRCADPDLIAVKNGLFDYKTKQLLPFTPEQVFVAKCGAEYNPAARNPVIHNPKDNTDWDVESWIAEFSDDPVFVDLIWQIIGATIRPNVKWNKSAWFYAETGNNGKGTLCELMRNLCGPESHASISISQFKKDFLLEPLINISAVIVDENDVGMYIDSAQALKSVITGDPIQINRKFKKPITYQFKGFMIQCLNELPRIKDKTDSFYRRLLFVPFTKTFKGIERKYIKADYLKRRDVLEYVLYRVLHMNYYELSEPDACKTVLNQYKEHNDPVRAFFEEMQTQLVWDLQPFTFLYDLYKAWFKENVPSGSLQSRNTFINDICAVVDENPDWTCQTDRTAKIRSAGRMVLPEPLIARYGLTNWLNSTYTGKDPMRACIPEPAVSYRGILRTAAPAKTTASPPKEDHDHDTQP